MKPLTTILFLISILCEEATLIEQNRTQPANITIEASQATNESEVANISSGSDINVNSSQAKEENPIQEITNISANITASSTEVCTAGKSANGKECTVNASKTNSSEQTLNGTTIPNTNEAMANITENYNRDNSMPLNKSSEEVDALIKKIKELEEKMKKRRHNRKKNEDIIIFPNTSRSDIPVQPEEKPVVQPKNETELKKEKDAEKEKENVPFYDEIPLEEISSHFVPNEMIRFELKGRTNEAFKEYLVPDKGKAISIRGAYVTIAKKGNIDFQLYSLNTKKRMLVFEKNASTSGQFFFENLLPGEYQFRFYSRDYWGKSDILFALHLEGWKETKVSAVKDIEHFKESDIRPTNDKLIKLGESISKIVVQESLHSASYETQYKRIVII